MEESENSASYVLPTQSLIWDKQRQHHPGAWLEAQRRSLHSHRVRDGLQSWQGADLGETSHATAIWKLLPLALQRQRPSAIHLSTFLGQLYVDTHLLVQRMLCEVTGS